MSDRNTSTPIKQVFGDVEKGTTCRVCGRNVTDGRMKYCSEYCKNLANAVMNMLNWSGVRRRIIKRDDETCQVCEFDYAKERHARRHIQSLIDEQLPEQPQGPALAEDREDFDWDAHFDKMEVWQDKREQLREKYGDPHEMAIRLEVDHITPISQGGHPFDPGNLQTLCEDCHKDKTASEASEWAGKATPAKRELNESLFEYVRE